MPLHYFDPDTGAWKTIQNPGPSDIAEVLIAASHDRPCEFCDADVEYNWPESGVPDIVIIHEPGCAA